MRNRITEKKRMNRKGAETWVLFAGIIALVVLAIVFIFLLGFGGDLTRFLKNFGINLEKEEVFGVEIIGYKIDEGNLNKQLQYYNGVEWVPIAFGSKVTISNKEIGQAKVLNQIKDFYYGDALTQGRDLARDIDLTGYGELEEEIKGVLDISGALPYLNVKIDHLSRGEIYFNYEAESGSVLLTLYPRSKEYDNLVDYIKDVFKINRNALLILENDGDLILLYSNFDDVLNPEEGSKKIESSKGVYSTIRSKTAEWRDSILKDGKNAKHVGISYVLTEEREKGEVTKCYLVERRGEYLAIKLDEPADGGC